jgi:putative DNA primase/helicase
MDYDFDPNDIDDIIFDEAPRPRRNPAHAKTNATISIKPNNLPHVMREIDRYICEHNLPVYQRSGILVTLGECSSIRKSGIEFIDITAELLRVILTDQIRFTQGVMQKGPGGEKHLTEKDINCPLEIAKAYLGRRGAWKINAITAIVTAPTMREDGSLIEEAGLDLKTGIYLDYRGVEFLKVPNKASKEIARAALDYLIEMVKEVPFLKDEDGRSSSRSVFLSMALTALIRPILPSAPLHGISAPEAGSGKGMLVSAVSILATGDPPAVIAQGQTEEETEKRLGSVIRYGDQVVAIDNCTAPLAGSFLCQCISEPILSHRILGKSERIKVPNTALYTATGNNLTVSGDMARRTLRCRIDAEQERPETRTFKTQRPDKRARNDRANLVVAGLSVLRAYWQAARPKQTVELGSFEDWSRTVRDALIWLGDPIHVKVSRSSGLRITRKSK